jgi:Subtilase family
VDKGVHIISMSWTVERTDMNAKVIAEFEKAIELAAKEGILMFCAATDQGAYKDRSYPAASSTKKLFKIGAAEASGTALKWLGEQRAVDFIFPGHQVVKERPGDVPVDKYTSLTGSSVATALATGLAAVILYCVQVGAQPVRARHRGVTMDDFRALKKHSRMRDAFLEIGTTDESEKKYIAVWERFKEAVKKAESEPRDKWIDIVTDLAALLKKRQL